MAAAGTRVLIVRRLPVIVCGAGPVGLVAALALEKRGVECIVLERNASVEDDLRASTFHPPTLEYLDELDLARPLIDSGLIARTWQVRIHETHEHARFDLDVLAADTRYPFRLQNEQKQLCRLASSAAAACPAIDLRYGVELVGVTQDDSGVTVTARRGDGRRERLRAAYLVAADGGRSTVRQILGMDFEGLTYPETTILATTTFAFEDYLPDLSNVNYVWCDSGTFSLLRLPDLWRVSLYADEGETVEEAASPKSVEAKLQRIVARESKYEVGEIRPYRIHQRIVADYRAGRVLLAGDAAHLNSPSGGMGMNGGIHDAMCLAGVLAPVWRDEAGEATLDRYTRRRRPIAREQILQQAHANRSRMQERDPERRRAQLDALRRTAGDPDRAREYLLASSMISGLKAMEAIE